MAPSMMESIVMRKCNVSRKKAKEITEKAKGKLQLNTAMMWSKEWEEECLKIHHQGSEAAQEEELGTNSYKKVEKVPYRVIQPTVYIPGAKTLVCGCGASTAQQDTGPSSQSKRTPAAPVVVPSSVPEPLSPLKRRPTIGRPAATTTSSRPRSLSRGRGAARSRSRGRTGSKSRECLAPPDPDKQQRGLCKNTSGSTKKTKKNGTMIKKTKSKEPVPVETPLMRRRSRSRARKQLYASGSEDEKPAEQSENGMSEDETYLDSDIPLSRSFSRLQWNEDETSEDDSEVIPIKHNRNKKQSSASESSHGSWQELATPGHDRWSSAPTRQNSFTEKKKKSSADRPKVKTDAALHMGRSRSRTRQPKHLTDQQPTSEKPKTDDPKHEYRSRSRTNQSSSTAKGKNHGEDSVSSTESPVRRRRSISRTRQAHIADKGKHNSGETSQRDLKSRSRSITQSASKSGKSREMDGSNRASQVVLFDHDSEHDTCSDSDSTPVTPSSKRPNALTQHLQNLEATPGSTKSTPGRSKQRIVMVRSSSIGRHRGRSRSVDTDSESEGASVNKGPQKTPPARDVKTPRQGSILRRKSRFGGNETLDCPDLNSSKTWYDDSHSIVAV